MLSTNLCAVDPLRHRTLTGASATIPTNTVKMRGCQSPMLAGLRKLGSVGLGPWKLPSFETQTLSYASLKVELITNSITADNLRTRNSVLQRRLAYRAPFAGGDFLAPACWHCR